jgi:hypothetical protein cdiviTM7_02684
MKQSDIFSIIIIATVGTLATYLGINSLLGDPNLRSEKIKTIEPISAELKEPDSELFNPDAINPTVEVYIGDCNESVMNLLTPEERKKCKNAESN